MKRYATGAALADDLLCFQEGRPISARAVGQTERPWRWCRQNPALASSLVAGAVSLALGMAFFTWLAIRANANTLQAEPSRDETAKALKLEGTLARAAANLTVVAI